MLLRLPFSRHALAGILTALLTVSVSIFSQSSRAAETKKKSNTKTKKAAATGAGFVAGPLYFYSVTHDESTGWIYVIPFCKRLPSDEFQAMKKTCRSTSESGQRCETNQSVELKEAGGSKTRKFKLDYFVFVSEKDCVQDRESYTSGDVVPFH